MKHIEYYIIEKFRASKETFLENPFNLSDLDSDEITNICNKYANKYQDEFPSNMSPWKRITKDEFTLKFKIWCLAMWTPCSKKDMLKTFGLKETSYGTLFYNMTQNGVLEIIKQGRNILYKGVEPRFWQHW